MGPTVFERCKEYQYYVLRTLMSIFDPLGLLSHILIYPRILLQDLWRLGVSWDEPISGDVFTQWKSWVTNLRLVEGINIPRSYGLAANANSSIELHTFVDAVKMPFLEQFTSALLGWTTSDVFWFPPKVKWPH